MQRFLVLLTIVALAVAIGAGKPVKAYYGLVGSNDYIWAASNNIGGTDAWATFGDMPTALMDNTCAADSHYCYVLAGYDGSSGPGTMWRHPLGTATFTALATCPVGLTTGGCALIGDTIYYCGGYDQMSTAMDTILEYSISGNSWTSYTGPYSGATQYAWSPTVVACAGKLYYISGCNAPGATGPTTMVWAYTPGSGWAQKASLHQGRVFAHAVAYHDTIWLAGGNAEGVGLTATEFYAPTADTWIVNTSIFPSMPVDIWAGACGVAAGQMFIAAGVAASAISSTAYFFDFAGHTWSTDPSAMPLAVYRTTGTGTVQNQAMVYGGSTGGFSPTTTCQIEQLGPAADTDATVLSVAPTGRIASGTPLPFSAVVKNQGAYSATISAHMVVVDSAAGTPALDKDSTITLASMVSQEIVFGDITATNGKVYLITASVSTPGDQNHANDTLRGRAAAHIGSEPDGFGYVYQSTQEPGDTVTFSWIDPTGGTPITTWQGSIPGDDGYAVLSLPFTFPYYGQSLTSITVCTNGFLESDVQDYYSETALPAAVNNLIAGFWDDLNPSAGGTVYQYNDPANHYSVIGYVGVVRYGTSDGETFEMVLDDQGRIKCNYLTMNGALNSNTVGIQGLLGSSNWYLQYAFDGTPANHIVADSVSVLFYYPPYLGVAEQRGTQPRARLTIPTPCNRTELNLPAQLGTGTVELYNLTGRLVRSVRLDGRGQSVSLAGLARGLYFVRLATPGYTETRKLVLVQ